MSAVKGHYPRGANAEGQRPRPQWELTPWWMFWRPKWRCKDQFLGYTAYKSYSYKTERQLALHILEQKFGPEVIREYPGHNGQQGKHARQAKI